MKLWSYRTFSPFLFDRMGQRGASQKRQKVCVGVGVGGRHPQFLQPGGNAVSVFHASNSPQPVRTCRAAQMGCRHLTGRGWRGPGAAPGHPPDREGPPGVRRVNRSRVSRSNPPGPLEAGSVQAPRRKGVSRPAGHGSCAAVAQTLLTRAGGGRRDGRGSGGGQRVGKVALPPHLAPEACGFIHLGQRGEIHDVIVSVRAQVRRALAGLVAVLQQDGGPGLIRGPASLVVGPFPVNPTSEA